MPPEDTGINLAITAKQLIMGVISIAGTVIGLLWLVMNTFMSDAEHAPFETTLTSVNEYATQSKLENKDTNQLLKSIKKQQDDNFAKLSNEIAKAQEEQLILRRNVLKSVKLSKLSDREKNELRQVEEYMVKRGYLNPELLTNID